MNECEKEREREREREREGEKTLHPFDILQQKRQKYLLRHFF